MTIQQFFEKAVEGGWRPIDELEINLALIRAYRTLCEVVLDPLAWQAVGKTEGWDMPDDAEQKAMGLMFAIFNGKTIEQYFETL